MKYSPPRAASATRAPGLAACAALALCLALRGDGLGAEPAAPVPAGKAAIAEDKAVVLERNSAADGDKATPPTSEIITKSEVQSVDTAGVEALDEVIVCLARTVYWEARGEGRAGMEGIAGVVMNRLGHQGFPDTICGVVRQGRENGSCQFSWWCDGHPDDAEEEADYDVAKEIARMALNRQLRDITDGAMYFHQRGLHPVWAETYVRTREIGEHVFYKPGGDAAR